MTANVCQIVDSIASSPTVLLDLNAGADTQYGFAVRRFDAPPPPLRRTVSSSMLSDGDVISGSAYENRVLSIDLDLIQSSQDNWATTWQTLARNIDQDTFWIKYQPTGATAPVFFKCYRAEVPQLDEVAGATAYRMPTLNIPAHPGAYGLPEDISAFVITNSPVTGTNKQFYTLPTIKGDLETPLLLAQTSACPVRLATQFGPVAIFLASYSVSGNTHALMARNLTELTSGTNTGAPVTGAGGNYIDGDYKSCSFATTTSNVRLSGAFSTTLTPMPGKYRCLLRVTAPASVSSVYTHQIGVLEPSTAAYVYNDATSTTLVGSGSEKFALIDCGIVQFPVNGTPYAPGLGANATTTQAANISILASCTVAQPIRYDEIYFVPVETNYGYGQYAILNGSYLYAATHAAMFDSFNDRFEAVYDASGTAPFSGIPVGSFQTNYVGGLPTVRPGFNNYLFYAFENAVSTDTTTFVGRYYPRYLYVRPSAT